MDNEEKRIIGRQSITYNRCELDTDGYWKAINEVVDKVLYEGDTDWREEKIEAMSIDRDAQTAIETAMGSNLNYLVQNVYQSGFKDLVEYKNFLRELENAKKLQSQNS